MDLATWSLILSIAALVLAMPLAMLANLVTPKIQNWWASTSQRRLENRIMRLKDQIEDPPSLVVEIMRAIAVVPLLISVVLLNQYVGILFEEPRSALTQKLLPIARVLLMAVTAMYGFLAQLVYLDVRRTLRRLRKGERKYVESYVKVKSDELDTLIRKLQKSGKLNSTETASIQAAASPAPSSSPARESSPPRS